jgi:hypothetical protein
MAYSDRMPQLVPLSGMDLKRIREAAKVGAEKVAERSGLAYWTIRNIERPSRKSVGRPTAMRYLVAIAEESAARQKQARVALKRAAAVKPRPSVPGPSVELLAELRAEQSDLAAKRERESTAYFKELAQQQQDRRDIMHTDDGLLSLFIAEWTEAADSSSILVTPVAHFEMAFRRFCELEGLKGRDEAIVWPYLRQHYRCSPGGVHGLLLRWSDVRQPDASRHSSRANERPAPVSQWEGIAAESLETEIRTHRRAGLGRGRWGERREDDAGLGWANHPWARGR